MPPQPGSTGQKRHRKWWRFSSYVGAANVARIERADQSLDGPALAGRVPTLEDDAQRRTDLVTLELTAQHQAQPQQA
jgi:hypothetical protein